MGILEEKLDLMFGELKNTLSKGELNRKDYALEKERLTEKYLGIKIDDSIKYFESVEGELELKINFKEEEEGIECYMGLNDFYHALKGTPLSEAAQKDVENRIDLEAEVYAKLKERFSDKPVLFGKLMNYADKLITEKTGKDYAGLGLSVKICFENMHQFNIVPEEALTKTFLN